MSFDLVRGDLLPVMPVAVTSGGVAVNLSTASSVEMHWVDPAGTEFTRALTPVSAAAGTFTLDWIAGDNATEGVYQGQVVAVIGGSPRTFPSDGSTYVWWVNGQVGDC